MSVVYHARLLKFDWPKALQLICNCTAEKIPMEWKCCNWEIIGSLGVERL